MIAESKIFFRMLANPPLFADEARNAPTTIRRDIERTERVVWRTQANRSRLSKLGYAKAGRLTKMKGFQLDAGLRRGTNAPVAFGKCRSSTRRDMER